MVKLKAKRVSPRVKHPICCLAMRVDTDFLVPLWASLAAPYTLRDDRGFGGGAAKQVQACMTYSRLLINLPPTHTHTHTHKRGWLIGG